ncbi:KIAA1875 [Bugula neritina]|uniref:KIAA1875 n=1 Tax=Bugula neritina TaxID=10212 RepID=A0A7J7KI18_BUGNE|nr:KIAA1875 [Bugula neritina]
MIDRVTCFVAPKTPTPPPPVAVKNTADSSKKTSNKTRIYGMYTCSVCLYKQYLLTGSTPPPTIKEPTPTPTPTPPPPPPTPLPEFVTQFFPDEWFQQYFPNCTSYTFPKPWTVEHFITQLLRILKMADYSVKLHIMAAIRKLYHNEGFKNVKEAVDACFDVLNLLL